VNQAFRKRVTTPRLAPDQAARQGQVSRMAFEILRQPAAVIAFLNTHDAALGGRPIDLAVASHEGLLSVERALAALPLA
jgi:uncharacterized protein (DUF2384 family)